MSNFVFFSISCAAFILFGMNKMTFVVHVGWLSVDAAYTELTYFSFNVIPSASAKASNRNKKERVGHCLGKR